VLAVAAAPTAGAAQTPEEPTVLHACYVPGAGVVYRVAGPDEETPELPAGCKAQAHVPFSWNEAGPEGPAGPAGPPGPAGTFQCREPGAAAGVGRSGATGPTSPGAGPRAVSVLARAATMGLDPFVGEVALVPYHFAPRGWTFAEGQLMSISQNAALFSLLGTTYGGDGQTTFALPDMRGLEPVCGMHYVIALQGIYPSRN
jgi:hypothetical protein